MTCCVVVVETDHATRLYKIMNLDRFCLKFFAQARGEFDDALFIDIFHEWIRLKSLPGTLLDVADYRHVPEGPGIMLITHEINFAMDYTNNRFGLLAQRKLGDATTHQERILELLRATITFGTLLEADSRLAGQLQLDGSQFEYASNDRLLLPNTAEAYESIRPDLTVVAGTVYPHQEVTISRVENDPRDRLTAVVKSSQPVSLAALAEGVGALA